MQNEYSTLPKEPVTIVTSAEHKQIAREEVRYRRCIIKDEHGDEYADKICQNFLKTIPLMPQSVISAYWPVNSEADVKPLMEKLISNGHTLSLPAIADDRESITFRRYRLYDPIMMGPFRIPQPFDSAENMNPSVILVPILGFNRNGHRLGYGKGFYDTLLAEIRMERPVTVVGIAFSEQEIDFPFEEHDQTMDWIITEQECIKIK